MTIQPAVPSHLGVSYNCMFVNRNSPQWGVRVNGIVHLICTTVNGKSYLAARPGICVTRSEPRPLPATCGDASRPIDGNPVAVNTGTKLQITTDYEGGEGGAPTISRQYRSAEGTIQQEANIGWLWTVTGYRSLALDGVNAATVNLGDGSYVYFAKDATGNYKAPLGVYGYRLRLVNAATSEYELLDESDRADTFAPINGKLRLIRSRLATGHSQTYAYDAQDRLLTTTGPSGRSITFLWNAESIIGFDAPGLRVRYEFQHVQYNAAPVIGTGRLSRVTYSLPDAGSASSLIYHYENAQYPSALTGLTDELGSRFATYSYDWQGRVLVSERANGAGRVSMSYNDTTVTTGVTDALGTLRTYSMANIKGTYRSKGVSQPGGAGCAPAASSIGYDTYGNATTIKDFNGNLICSTYETTTGLKTKEVSGLTGNICPGAAVAGVTKTKTTQWHAVFRKPVLESTPNLLTTITYDAQGNVLTKSLQSTSDNDGSQGLAAQVVGAPRIWTSTYNSQNQLVAHDGPLEGPGDITLYHYHDADDAQTLPRWRKGDMHRIVNGLGHEETIDLYDSDGRVIQRTDPNGLITTVTYHHRGWIRAVSTSAGGEVETTLYDYWPTGRVRQITNPDGTYTIYSYDQAQRLTGVVDQSGNSVSYLLDLNGNVTLEQHKDSAGLLRRNITRAYDALGRLQAVTGARK
jgi:YD repeat-containing protein